MQIHKLGLAVVLLLNGCTTELIEDETSPEMEMEEEEPEPEPDPVSEEAFALLTGRFDSADQAEADMAYFAVQLLTCRIDAPTLGEHVLYVEQAVMTSLAAPYRQRLYVVEPGADPATQVLSRVFELADPDAFVGFCDAPRTVAAAEATERQGCVVELTQMADQFVGSTDGDACLSDFQGATYATSEVTVAADRVFSWDRGYDAEGQQVWGATAGAYEFLRRTPLPEN